ncbi:hypothetical protein [Streptomyces sp. NPDC059008]|uniref:hypothetical protein n=1 Tax=Streptomyces sp. NPDC059008 TaxID=3346693 RepID=UPI003677C37C
MAPSHGRDLRVVIVDGEPVAAAVRTARDDALASNLARGGAVSLCRGRYPEAHRCGAPVRRAGVACRFGPPPEPAGALAAVGAAARRHVGAGDTRTTRQATCLSYGAAARPIRRGRVGS